MRIKLLCFFAILFFSGCALPRGIHSPETVEKIKTVALVVAIEDAIDLDYVGFTVFNNKQEHATVNWNVTDYVLEETKKYLRPRYELASFPYDPDFFKGADTSSDATLGTATEVTERLKKIARPGVADAILVVVSGSSGWVSTNRHGNFVGTSFTMTVFDGATIEPIAQAYGGIPCQRALCLNGYDSPGRRVSFRWTGTPYASLPQAMRDEIHAIALALLNQAVPNTLGRLGLIPKPITE